MLDATEEYIGESSQTDVLMSENMIKERKESSALMDIRAVCNGLTFVAKVSFLPLSM